jgi:type I restriction enzyme S subunit
MVKTWEQMTIGEAAEFTSKPRGLDYALFPRIPFVPMEQVPTNGTYIEELIWKRGDEVRSGNYFEKGDCLLAKITPCFENGKQGIARDLPADFGVASTELIPFRGRDGISNKYFLFFYFLDVTTRRQIAQKMEGATGRQRIPISVLKNWHISLPPIPEQKNIAAILLMLQRAIETQDNIIQSLRDLKKSTMQHLFTNGLRGEKTIMTEFGPIPFSWEVVSLDDCCTVQTGIAKGRNIPSYEAIELPYLRVANVQDGHLNLNEIKTIFLRKNEKERYLLQNGDVVLTEGGDFDKLGRGFVWEGQIENCVHQNHIFAVRVDHSSLMPRFLAYLVQSPYGKAYFLKVAHKTTNLACINTAKLKGFPIALPSPKEQQDIVNILWRLDENIGFHGRKKQAHQDLFKTILNSLIKGEIRMKDLDINVAGVVP